MDASDSIFRPLTRQLSYLFDHKNKFQDLRSKVQDLKDARERVQQSVDSANRKGEVISYDVQRWLTEVDEKISDRATMQLLEDDEDAEMRCFAGFCPDFKSRYMLGKKAKKEVDAITQLLTIKDAFSTVSYLHAVEEIDVIGPIEEYEAIDVIGPIEEYETVGSRSVAFDGVMEAMKDDTVSIIGVYEVRCVDRTTLVKEAARQAEEKHMFNEVIFIATNQTPYMVNVRKEIAEKLGLPFYEENIDPRTSRICGRLKEEKRVVVVVVLDNIWVSLNSRALRITSVDEHKGCNILMTFRMSNVLKLIDFHPNISTETLKEDETRNLFKRMVDHIVKRRDLQSKAIEVAKRCAGLSIVVATIAKTLKPKENFFEWRDALRQLSKPSVRNFEVIPKDAYSAIELSYKFLEGDEFEPIFLLSSILGHDVTVEDLLRHAIGLVFIHDVNMLEESRDRVLTLVNNLKASCLLLEGSHPTHFDMHDVVRDVIQSLASRDLCWLVLFKKWSDKNKVKKSQPISLQNVEVFCPALEELKLDLVSGIEKIWHTNDLLPIMSSAVQSLTSLTLKKCCKFKNGEVIFDDVQRWLTEVNGKISEQAATQLQEDEEKAIKRCFMGFCPDFKSRYHFSKKADMEANAITQLLTKKDAFNAVGYLPAVEVMDIIRPVKEYEAFGSRRAAFDEVMVALEDETVSIIGVHGMGGVGKTTLVKEVAAQAKEKLSFDEVVFAAVTQTPNTMNIQNEIANQLGLELDKDSSEHVRAVRLRDRLKKAKKILVILDDLWQEQELVTFGIPSVDQHKGCKMLMTSRSLDVLKRMDSRHNILIDILKEDEAWNLFKKMAGDIVERPDLRSAAVDIAKRCAGLPIAIATIAKALKPKENLCEWRDALRRLSKPSERNFKGIPAKAYSAIELSYKFLEGEELGPTFLLCSIMGHDATVEDLLRYGIGLGFIHDVNTIKESRDSILTLVNNLKTSCLLLEGSHPTRFDMHDVVRDVAQSIASRDLHWLALFKEWPEEEKMKESQLISLQNAETQSLGICQNAFSSLPSSLDSLKTLCTLRLIDCHLEDITILGELENLEILDLHKSDMKMLPKEIGHLTKLKLLDLSYCNILEVISPNVLSKLSKLEELYIYDSFDKWEAEGIDNPRSNASLVELQHLSRLTTLEVHVPHMEAIPKDNLFLGKMERYKISIGHSKWHRFYDERRMEASRMLKLKINKNLNRIQCHESNDIKKELFSKLKTLEVSRCDEMEGIIEGTSAAEEAISYSIRLFPKLVSMTLTFLPKLRRFFCEINPIEFPSLRHLEIRRCRPSNTFTFNNGKSRVTLPHYLFNERVILPVLEKLDIFEMDNMEGLWPDQLVEHSYSKPTSIYLHGCPKLLNVFPLSMLPRLESLKSIWISSCEPIEEIIYEGGDSSSSGKTSFSPQFIQSFEFPNLTSLSLSNLPNLKSIHRNKMLTINWPSLKNIRVVGCENVEILFAASGETSSHQPLFRVNESTFPNLQELTLGWNAGIKHIIWHCQGQQQQQHFVSPYFPNLKVVKLEGYPEQLTALPSYLFHLLSLPNIQTLVIWGCSFKEMMFQSEEGGEEKPASLLLSHITKLRLDSLDELMHLWKEKKGFRKLRTLQVSRCPKLKVNLVPSSVSFRNLVTLEVEECHGIIKLITHSTAKSLVKLQHMIIENCKNIQEIIQGEDDDDDDDEISFPKLSTLRLENLPKLESFCSSDKCTFGFPSLDFLFLDDCPKMKIFSQGKSNTPLLHEVQINDEEEEERWEGNLNSTIQKLFLERRAMIEEYEDSEEDESNSLTTTESEECENSNEDQSNPSTSNTQIPGLVTYLQGSMKFDADSNNDGHGVYMVGLCFTIYQIISTENPAPLWNLIRRLSVPQRIRTFLWLVCHGKLLSNQERVRRHLTMEDACVYCNDGLEDILHVLRDCVRARTVWMQVVSHNKLVQFHNLNLLDWLTSILSQPQLFTTGGVDLSTRFAVICWILWTRRNKFLFDNTFVESKSVLMECMELLSTMNSKPVALALTISSPAKWFAPPHGWVKANVDGAVRLHDSAAVCGGLIRDEEGNWLIGFSRSLGCCSVLFAELWGVHDALKHAWSMGHRCLILESDSADVVDMFNKQQVVLQGNTLTSEIRRMINLDWEVRIRKINWDCNRVAGALAGRSCGLPTKFQDLRSEVQEMRDARERVQQSVPWLTGRERLKWLELLGAAPVDVAVLLASWEVCSWSHSGLSAAFIDVGFFAGSWRKCCCCKVPIDVEKVVGSSRMVRSIGLATYFQGSMKFDADRSVLFSCPLGVMNTTTAELQAIEMCMEKPNQDAVKDAFVEKEIDIKKSWNRKKLKAKDHQSFALDIQGRSQCSFSKGWVPSRPIVCSTSYQFFKGNKMDVLVSIVGSLVAKATEYTVGPTARQLSYLFKPRSKFLNLRSKVQELKDARERVQQSVDSANRKGEVIFDDVQRWLIVANEKISEEAATQLQEDEEKARKRCLAGFCPYFKSSYRLSKKADKEANAIAQLLIQKDNFEGVSYPSDLRGIDIIRPVKEYEAFASRSVALDGVMAALEDDTLSIIGVYGMGGVGKTTLVEEAARQANEKKLFNDVVLVSIKQKPNMVNIQKELAEKLGMTICEENIDVRAARLRERLKEKNILIILDDIWEFLELEAIGISSGDEHKGCKMLMTSRRLDVLESLNSQTNISIETLIEDEAWTLFKKMAGLVEGSDFQSTAVEVAKRCAGLPIAIATIAKALKPKKNLFEWKDALRQLSQPSERNFKGIPKDAYSAIELSYTFLDSEEHRPIFLLCSVMPHDSDPEDLLRYAIGLGFIHDLNTIEASRDRVLTLVSDLKASCLLLDGSRPNCFDMHDVVRDVAQSIASRDLHWLTLFKELTDEEKMKKSRLISLQNLEVSELLNNELDCPELNYFSIGLEGSSLKLSNNFFMGMQRLKVLEFAKTHFTALPSSVGSLKTLCTLRLLHCKLKDIVILGELKKLEILDLCGSKIIVLPKEIGQLTGLKLLDLSYCDDLEVISPNVLSKLSKLEELYLYGSFDKWEDEGKKNPRSNASLVELQNLSHLITLEVHIPNVEAIPKDNLFFGKMERYKISIGDEKWDSHFDRPMKTSRMLKLGMNKSMHLVDGIKHLLRKSQSLYLNGMEDVEEMQMLYHPNVETIGQLRFIKVNNCNMMKNLFSFSIAKRLSQLEELEVSNCKNITVLIEEKEEIDDNDILEFNKLRILKLDKLNRFNGLWYSQNIPQSSAWLFDKKVKLPMLEELEIRGMEKLERLWADQLVEHSFSKLTSIRLEGCPKLLNVFPLSMLTRLQRLKRLVIWECESVEEIIYEGGCISNSSNGMSSLSPQFIQSFEFPNLTSLTLWNLPNLKSIHHNKMLTINWPSLKEMKVAGCNKVEIVFANSAETSSQQPLFWVNEVSCPGLELLEVEKCHKLKYVFTSSVVKSFVHLKTLGIYQSDEMDGVIEGKLTAEEEEGISSSIKLFPKLDFLYLIGLPNLKRFGCAINPIEFPSLKSLMIQKCRALNTFTFDDGKSRVTPPHYLFDEKVNFSVIERLEIREMDNLERLWADQLVEHSFSKLTSISLIGCPKLLSVFPLSMLSRLQGLHELSIQGCELVGEIISEGGGSRISGGGGMPSLSPQFIQSDVEFPNLTSLSLRYLSNLKSIHHNKLHTINWPSLKEMTVDECHAVKILFANSEEISSQEPLFRVNEESTFPNLHRLTLVWDGEGQQQQQQNFVSPYFPNLKVVGLEWYPEQVTVLPSYLLSLPNFQTLEITRSYFKEMIFQSEEGGEEKPASLLLSNITELRLRYLDKLMHLWKEKEGFPNLRILHVFRCPELKVNLVPSSVSFQNLVTLEVEICNGIRKLITHSTAKSLVQLKYMRIWRCLNIEEIIQGGDDDDDEISFPQLSTLRLENLPKLESFSSSDKYTFGFPSLQFLVVQKCPKMKMFSQGHSNTPMLHQVQLDTWSNEERWEGNLNSVVQKLFREKNLKKEMENFVKDPDSYSTSKEDQSKPSTSNTQNLTAIMENSSTSNCE
ncbi:hypothetical protein GQ457_02G040270 [Hibiscus cannabinus]